MLGRISLVDVDFRYPSRPENLVCDKYCLEIEAGQTIALVGESGSGKSTIVNLLQRFYDPLVSTPAHTHAATRER